MQISLCGGFAIKCSDGRDVKIANRKACALLAYLCLSKTGIESREQLAGLFWTDRSEIQARASLRQCLKQIRSAFGDVGFSGFKTGRHDVSLSTKQVHVDLLDSFQHLQNNHIDDLLLTKDGTPDRILYGLDVLSESFTAWLYVIRRNWLNHIVGELERQLKNSSGTKQKRVAEALINIDLTHEIAHRSLIKFHADIGNAPSAIRQYELLWNILERDYDMEPDNVTQELVVKIKLGTYGKNPQQDNISPNLRPDFSVAPNNSQHPILQIQQFSAAGNPKIDDILVDGFRQDLIAGLVRFRDWIILDGKQLENLPANSEISKPAGPSFLIDGTLSGSNSDIHLTLTLKSTEKGQYLWSERLKLNYDDWNASLRHFVTRISTGLSIYLSASEIDLQLPNHELSKESYLLWHEAYRLIWSWEPDSRKRAEQLFRQIISNSPSFAPAYSGIASIFNTEQIIYPGVFADQKRLDEAIEFARIAVSLDPLDVRSQSALAWSNGMNGRYELAENHHRLVYDLNPNNPTTLISCANGLAMCGNGSLAKSISDEAIEILPSINPSLWGYLASTRFLAGEYKECIEATEKAGPTAAVPGWRAAALGHIGSRREAEEAGQQFMDFIRPRWRGKVPCEPTQVANWFLQQCPIKEKATRDRIREGLEIAGLKACA